MYARGIERNMKRNERKLRVSQIQDPTKPNKFLFFLGYLVKS